MQALATPCLGREALAKHLRVPRRLGQPEIAFGQRQAQQQRVRARPVLEQVDDLLRPPLLEKEIGVGGKQEVVAHAERQGRLEVALGGRRVTQARGHLREAGMGPQAGRRTGLRRALERAEQARVGRTRPSGRGLDVGAATGRL